MLLHGFPSQQEVAAGDVIAVPAVLRAFSALPLHLRHQLGPRIADRLLALDEADAAYNIQQAILLAQRLLGLGFADQAAVWAGLDPAVPLPTIGQK